MRGLWTLCMRQDMSQQGCGRSQTERESASPSAEKPVDVSPMGKSKVPALSAGVDHPHPPS